MKLSRRQSLHLAAHPASVILMRTIFVLRGKRSGPGHHCCELSRTCSTLAAFVLPAVGNGPRPRGETFCGKGWFIAFNEPGQNSS
jgi:hypothetical protein